MNEQLKVEIFRDIDKIREIADSGDWRTHPELKPIWLLTNQILQKMQSASVSLDTEVLDNYCLPQENRNKNHLLLDFGKYNGKTINEVPISYVLFLAGYRLVGSKKEKCELSSCKWIQEHKKEVHESATRFIMGRCWICGGKLVPIGDARFNGAAHGEWDSRYLHKQCWRELRRNEHD